MPEKFEGTTPPQESKESKDFRATIETLMAKSEDQLTEQEKYVRGLVDKLGVDKYVESEQYGYQDEMNHTREEHEGADIDGAAYTQGVYRAMSERRADSWAKWGDKLPKPHDGCENCSAGEIKEDGDYLYYTVFTCRDHGVTNFRTYDAVFTKDGENIGYGYAPKVIAEHEGEEW